MGAHGSRQKAVINETPEKEKKVKRKWSKKGTSNGDTSVVESINNEGTEATKPAETAGIESKTEDGANAEPKQADGTAPAAANTEVAAPTESKETKTEAPVPAQSQEQVKEEPTKGPEEKAVPQEIKKDITPTEKQKEPLQPTEATNASVEAKSPEPTPVFVQEVKAPEPTPAAEVKSPEPAPAPVQEVKTPEPTPAAAEVKAPEPAPAPVQDVKAPEPTPAAAEVKAPEPAPAPVQEVKAPEPAPAAAEVKAPEPAPAPVQEVKAPEPTPAAAEVKAPAPAPVQEVKAPEPAPSPVEAKAPEPAPAPEPTQIPQEAAVSPAEEPPVSKADAPVVESAPTSADKPQAPANETSCSTVVDSATSPAGTEKQEVAGSIQPEGQCVVPVTADPKNEEAGQTVEACAGDGQKATDGLVRPVEQSPITAQGDVPLLSAENVAAQPVQPAPAVNGIDATPVINGNVAQDQKQTLESIPYTFTWESGGKQVALSGSFNQWADPVPLAEKSGVFSINLKLSEGEYHYKYQVDGNWVTNNTQPVTELEGHGQVNVVVVKAGTEE